MFKENYIITGTIVCESGLHIGGSSDTVDIGGSDNPVIRDVITGKPYIPGSSLKGKLRSLLELSDKKSSQSVIDNNKNGNSISTDENCIAVQLFGTTPKENTEIDPNKSYQTRTIIRDSFPTKDTVEKWENSDELFNGVEIKWENTIDRITSEAKPRNIERIPRGSEFNLEIIFSTYSDDESKNIVKLLESMMLLENNYLGGSGSRGSGQVRFKDILITKRGIDYYTKDAEEIVIVKSEDVDGAINKINE